MRRQLSVIERVIWAFVRGFLWFFFSNCVIGGVMTLAVVENDWIGWSGLACAAVIGVLAGRRYYLKSAPQPRWICRTCGYNLYGNTSGIYPECGTPIEQQ